MTAARKLKTRDLHVTDDDCNSPSIIILIDFPGGHAYALVPAS